ncbi:hypothetical protein BJ138DRAFT_1055951 [Hygrophoropsis aurantiaca]|uniref:Uncharacterized protein n=1 Tax=Hygrophoropsis aurantiaca TaxID=72124 RepID=A0ACB8APE9_9AGAM|nr:hypothetical protein BJ138DRAFT_1055951 [Hygrophoropsis aurantiaca]
MSPSHHSHRHSHHHHDRHHPQPKHAHKQYSITGIVHKATLIVKYFLFVLLLPFTTFLRIIYVLAQHIITALFKPPLPPDVIQRPYARIAIIGAGLTGVSSAAHALAHGFEVVIYEAADRPGGIWARENKTSGLQLNSLLYRFHPGVMWRGAFPRRDAILEQITKIWKEYKLENRTRFNIHVTKVRRIPRECSTGTENFEDGDKSSALSPSKWIINDGKDGEFDALIVTVGTCGEPKWVDFEGMAERPKGDNAEESNERDQQEQSRDVKTKRTQHKESGSKRKHSRSHSPSPSSAKEERVPKESKKQSKKQKKARQAGDTAVTANTIDKEEDDYEAGDSSPTHVKRPGSPLAQETNTSGGISIHDKDEKTAVENSNLKTEGGERDNVFSGPILHSSQLDNATPDLLRKTTIAVIGSGASAVEAVETALERGAERCVVLAREDKWIIPRNIIFDTCLAAQPFGRETPLSFLWEVFLRFWHYHGVEDLLPHKSIFGGTPVVNDEFLNHVRSGKCVYVRGDTVRLTKNGVQANVHEIIERGEPLGFGPGVQEDIDHIIDDESQDESERAGSNRSNERNPDEEKEKEQKTKKQPPQEQSRVEDIRADIVILATGYKHPDLGFLPKDLFPEGYDRPNMYLQNFSTEDWSLLMTNSAYLNAIGTVGHVHIGIYTRILLTLLLDPNARPTPKDMKLWVDVVRFVKRGASGGALSFFTYMELTIWLLMFHVFRPDRLKWMIFIMQGWGVHPDDERIKRPM